jgi:hypothetical protein
VIVVLLASALLGQNIPSTAYDSQSVPAVNYPGLFYPGMPPNSHIVWGRYPQTLTAGQYTQFKLTQHACGCMEVPLAQGGAVLPCKAHDRRFKAIWRKGDAESRTVGDP